LSYKFSENIVRGKILSTWKHFDYPQFFCFHLQPETWTRGFAASDQTNSGYWATLKSNWYLPLSILPDKNHIKRNKKKITQGNT